MNTEESRVWVSYIWDNYNNYSPPIIAFWGASRRRIWTKIGGNESQDLPGPPYLPQNPRFGPENLENNNQHIKKRKNKLLPYTCEILLPEQNPEKANRRPKSTLRARNFPKLTLRSLNFRVLRVELSREITR